MAHFTNRHRGETILEVVTATVMVSLVLVAAIALFSRVIQANVNVKNRVVATGLAQEGIEMVRHVRDTNWLKYSGNRRAKWLCIDTKTDLNACRGGGTSPVIFSLNTPQTFIFEEDQGRPLLSLNNNTEKFRIFKDSESNLSHDSSGEATLFSRKISLTLRKDQNCDSATSATADCDDILDVVSEVFWQEENGKQTVTLQTQLFDFWERNEY